ncbi:MAG TPA: GntG family PLP-dependent aldolase [Acidimicrobiales bacterium]|nr:GntG family PLP-dependent aldolase [Acidimicrobiales bacterium]
MTRRVDLRSDTVTQPTPAMRQAMAEAVVGDDGYGEDPTVVALERRYGELVGKEAAVFVPSGVMANQIALRLLTSPGDVIIAGRSQHVVSFEMGAAARNSSVQFATVDDARGVLELDDVLEIIDAELDHQPHVSMLAVENTHMPSGGTPWEADAFASFVSSLGGLAVHLDGARLFNAAVATSTSLAALAGPATTVMSCLSKGLCAPVGSVLAGPAALIERARVERKRLGGAMRQAGVIAAAGLVALDSMIDRLADDHRRAAQLAALFARAYPESEYDPASCRTNIVSFAHPEARRIVDELAVRGVLGGTVSPRRVRFVTHAQVSDDDVHYVADALADVTSRSRR